MPIRSVYAEAEPTHLLGPGERIAVVVEEADRMRRWWIESPDRTRRALWRQTKALVRLAPPIGRKAPRERKPKTRRLSWRDEKRRGR